MIIAKEKRKENIIEYLLYMWQVEDLLRACNLDIDLIVKNIVSKYEQPADVLEAIEDWYRSHLEMLVREGKQRSGHLVYLETIVGDLNVLHKTMLKDDGNASYKKLYKNASNSIQELSLKMPDRTSEIEVSLNGLYGFLLLKIQQKEISEQTETGIKNISLMLSHLADKFKHLEEGSHEL